MAIIGIESFEKRRYDILIVSQEAWGYKAQPFNFPLPFHLYYFHWFHVMPSLSLSQHIYLLISGLCSTICPLKHPLICITCQTLAPLPPQSVWRRVLAKMSHLHVFHRCYLTCSYSSTLYPFFTPAVPCVSIALHSILNFTTKGCELFTDYLHKIVESIFLFKSFSFSLK